MKTLFFVRHGQTLWNAVSRMQGQLDSDLSDLGRAQAQVNAQLLDAVGIEAIFASPLGRARQSVAIINEKLNLPIHFDDRIKEWDCGDWSGYLYADVRERWRAEWKALETDRFHYRGPNCENYPDMIARTVPFLAEIDALAATRIAIVSHGMIGAVMLSTLLGLDEAQTLAISQPNDTVFVVGQDRVEHYTAGEGPFAGLVWHHSGD